MNIQGITARMHLHRRHARQCPRRCYVPGCDKNAIRSHLLQKNGLLDQIAEDRHVVELREDDLFKIFVFHKGGLVPKANRYYFERVGINEALTFQGFCGRHDHELFSEIEQHPLDLTSTRAILLLSYRALLNELQKQENNIDWYRRMFADQKLMANWPPEYKTIHLEKRREMVAFAGVSKTTKAAFESALGLTNGIADSVSTSYRFKFEVFSLPRIELCTSAYFAEPVEVDIDLRTGDDYWRYLPDIPSYCVSILPSADGTTVIMGYYGDTDPTQFRGGRSSLEFINELVLKRVETWACGPRWYRECLQLHELHILKQIDDLLPAERKNDVPSLNLFSLR